MSNDCQNKNGVNMGNVCIKRFPVLMHFTHLFAAVISGRREDHEAD